MQNFAEMRPDSSEKNFAVRMHDTLTTPLPVDRQPRSTHMRTEETTLNDEV